MGRRWITDRRPVYVTYLGVEILKDCSWDTHTHSLAKVTGKGKAHVGKMYAILTDSHLVTTIGLRDVS